MSDGHDPDLRKAQHSLIMPFTIVESAGGRFQDESFVVGYELGQIDSELRICAYMPNGIRAVPGPRYIHTPALEQLDLIAMQHNFKVIVGDKDESGEWTWVDFE